MSKGLYWAYVKAWQEETPVSCYNLSPGAALMLRDIIDFLNSKFWPSFGCRISNEHFYKSCNFNDRHAVKRYRDELINANLISWHRDEATKNQPGYYQLIWKPTTVKRELNNLIKESSCCIYATATPSKLRIINGS